MQKLFFLSIPDKALLYLNLISSKTLLVEKVWFRLGFPGLKYLSEYLVDVMDIFWIVKILLNQFFDKFNPVFRILLLLADPPSPLTLPALSTI